jgi:hypothetical protein
LGQAAERAGLIRAVDLPRSFCYNLLPRRNVDMNKRLDEALTKVKALSDDQQQEAAEILFEYIEAREAGTWLTPEQIEEIERCLAEDEPFATEDEAKAVFARLTK